jgi:hypothetical protein
MLTGRSLSRTVLHTFVTALLATNVSCDSAGHPDTGAGANKTPPAVETCVDLCQRLADCVVTLCDEDTSSTRYDAIHDPVASSCVAPCTDAQIQSKVTPDMWSCIFKSSCRQVFQDDVCHGMSHYSCN